MAAQSPKPSITSRTQGCNTSSYCTRSGCEPLQSNHPIEKYSTVSSGIDEVGGIILGVGITVARARVEETIP